MIRPSADLDDQHENRAAALTRRGFFGVGATVGMSALSIAAANPASASTSTGPSAPTQRSPLLSMRVDATAPWQINQVVRTSTGTMFVSGPRHISVDQVTPGLGRRRSDGTIVPFPGNSWNEWKPGNSGVDQFVNPIGLEVFWDDDLWVCDWGAPMADPTATPVPGAQKVVRLDSRTGRIVDVLRFDDLVLPPGAKLNGLQRHGDYVYIADSGLGAIIHHDLRTGRTVRRLSGDATVTATAEAIARNPSTVSNAPSHSDTLHLTADGEWLYWSAPQGPFRRVRSALVRDTRISDAQLSAAVEYVADVDVTPGACMDTLGNLYLSYVTLEGFALMPTAPRDTAVRTTVVQLSESVPELQSPDECFIGMDRRLYTASSQFARGASAAAPWYVYSAALPQRFDGYALGEQISGRPRRDRSR
jgi:hypothetical protein